MLYRNDHEAIQKSPQSYIGTLTKLYSFHQLIQYGLMRLLPRVLSFIQSAKVSHAQLPDIPLRSGQASPSPHREYPSYPAGEKCCFCEEKASSRSAFSASMHVVLKTMHANLNIHVRRYQSYVRSPNLSATRPQLLSIRGATTQQRSLHKAIQGSIQSYIAFFAILYSSTHVLIYLYVGALRKASSSLLVPPSLPQKSEALG